MKNSLDFQKKVITCVAVRCTISAPKSLAVPHPPPKRNMHTVDLGSEVTLLLLWSVALLPSHYDLESLQLAPFSW